MVFAGEQIEKPKPDQTLAALPPSISSSLFASTGGESAKLAGFNARGHSVIGTVRQGEGATVHALAYQQGRTFALIPFASSPVNPDGSFEIDLPRLPEVVTYGMETSNIFIVATQDGDPIPKTLDEMLSGPEYGKLNLR